MDIEKLRVHIRALIMLEETAAPVLSCYLDLEAGYREFLDARVRVLRKGLRWAARPAFEEALSRVEIFLASERWPGAKGAAVFARGGERHFLLPLQFQVPLPNRLSVDYVPNVYELVELKDTYHRYVVLIAMADSARILEVNLGEVTLDLWTVHPELRERVGSGWTREHYQVRRRDRADRFFKEKIAVLDRLMSQGGHTHLILAGNPRIVARVRESLPRHLAEKLVDVVPAPANARTADIVAATLSTFVEHEAQESLETVALLLREIRRDGLAVCGTAPSLEALARGQADLLVMAGTYLPPAGWGCRACNALDVGAAPAACPQCGERQTRAADLKEQMVKLAERNACNVEIVRHSDPLMELGGVGCLLRYHILGKETVAGG